MAVRHQRGFRRVIRAAADFPDIFFLAPFLATLDDCKDFFLVGFFEIAFFLLTFFLPTFFLLTFFLLTFFPTGTLARGFFLMGFFLTALEAIFFFCVATFFGATALAFSVLPVADVVFFGAATLMSFAFALFFVDFCDLGLFRFGNRSFAPGEISNRIFLP